MSIDTYQAKSKKQYLEGYLPKVVYPSIRYPWISKINLWTIWLRIFW